jgi:hypothetical protein
MEIEGPAMPDDTTPHGGEALHQPPDRATIPEPQPRADSPSERAAGVLQPDPGHAPLPTEAEVRAVDISGKKAA